VGNPRPALIHRASADDVLQLAVDRGGRVPMVIGALLVLDGPTLPTPDAVRSLVLERAASVPRLSQRLVTVPLGAGRPVWVGAGADAVDACVDSVVVDPGIGVEHRSGLRDPDGLRTLLDALADLALTRMPLSGPLWRVRLLVAPGGGVSALALVAHHVLADGLGGLAVLAALADGAGGAGSEPGGGIRPPATVGGPPAWRVLAEDAWTERWTMVRGRGPAGGTRPPGRRLGSALRELGVRGRPRLADRCSLLGATGSARRVEYVHVDLAALRAGARAQGATVNDVVVTAVTGALVALLARRGEAVQELVVSMPVSRREARDAGALGNETGVVPVRVPAVPDRERRLAALVEARARVRAAGRGSSATVLTPAFRALAGVGAFQVFIDHQRLVHTFVTNVRGPAQRLAIAGAPVGLVVPLALNPGNVAVSFDVLSYAGRLGVTLVCDPVLVPESGWLAGRVAAELR
jgi:diacylglycerol O-acyltransferase